MLKLLFFLALWQAKSTKTSTAVNRICKRNEDTEQSISLKITAERILFQRFMASQGHPILGNIKKIWKTEEDILVYCTRLRKVSQWKYYMRNINDWKWKKDTRMCACTHTPPHTQAQTQVHTGAKSEIERNGEERDRNEQGIREGAREWNRQREKNRGKHRKSMSFETIRRDENVSN